MPEHPSNGYWRLLKGMLQPGMVSLGERPPEAPLEEHLAARRQVAVAAAVLANQVIDAIDQNPA